MKALRNVIAGLIIERRQKDNRLEVIKNSRYALIVGLPVYTRVNRLTGIIASS